MEHIIPIGYEATMSIVVSHGCTDGTRFRLVVGRGNLRSSCKLIQASIIGVGTGGSSPIAASTFGFFFVAL